MSAPEIKQTVPSSRPYQLWTREHVTWDTRPAGSLVVIDGWGVSYSHLDVAFSSREVIAADDLKWTLKVYRGGIGSDFVYHEVSGRKFDTQDEAQQVAFDAGVLAVMVYVEDFS